MAYISQTHHKVESFTKESKPFTDNVLLRLIAKGDKSELAESKCVSVPVIADSDILSGATKLLPAISAMIHDARQKIARKLVIEGATEIPTESISLDACINWLVDDSSGRLTTKVMQEWFTEEYTLPAMEFVCKQIRLDVSNLSVEQEKMVMQKTTVLRDVFAGFSSGKYKPPVPVCKMILGFGAFCADQIDTRMKVILEKTEKIRDEQIKMLEMDFDTLLESMPIPVIKTDKSDTLKTAQDAPF